MAPSAAARSLRAVEIRRKYHGYGFEAPLDVLKQHLWNAQRIELFPNDRIAFLDIPFGELFHRCTEEEWNDFRQLLSAEGVAVSRGQWWQLWKR